MTKTLRQWAGLTPPQSLDPTQTALILIDFQKEYAGEKVGIPGRGEAVAQAARLLAWARKSRIAVVHVKHEAPSAASPLFAAGSDAVSIFAELEPLSEEKLVVKRLPSSFQGTPLQAYLQEIGAKTVIVCGFMTHMCVDSTAREACQLGYKVVVAADACASRDLPDPLGGPAVDRDTVHRATLAALGDRFADILSTEAVLGLVPAP